MSQWDIFYMNSAIVYDIYSIYVLPAMVA